MLHVFYSIGYILNVTREIDNFFPGLFKYMNIRLYDDDEADLLKHWEYTHRFICKARDNNSKVLVHCKMGVSRSASTVSMTESSSSVILCSRSGHFISCTCGLK